MLLKSTGSRIVMVVVFFTLFLQVGITTTFANSITKAIQEALIEKGFDPGPADGIWGAKTKAAVVKFQESAGLTANGLVDGKTKSRLMSGSSESAASSSASAVSIPTTPAFSENDTGPDVADEEIAWGRHKS